MHGCAGPFAESTDVHFVAIYIYIYIYSLHLLSFFLSISVADIMANLCFCWKPIKFCLKKKKKLSMKQTPDRNRIRQGLRSAQIQTGRELKQAD